MTMTSIENSGAVPLAVADRMHLDNRGINMWFTDGCGHSHAISNAALKSLLTAMDTAPAQHMSPPIVTGHVAPQKKKLALMVPIRWPVGTAQLRWQITREDGTVLSGWLDAGGPESADSMALLTTPELDIGYHRLQILGQSQDTLLVVAPERAWQPESWQNNPHGEWGVSLQLYSLRSATNWGIGDFADLLHLLAMLAEVGARWMGLNPLHARSLFRPEETSPYAPSSRHALDLLYIRIENVPEFTHSKTLHNWLQQPAIQTEIARLQASTVVDYSAQA
jgi:4-alpha-glucanotransferase